MKLILLAGLVLGKKFQTTVALGDSISETGLVYELTKGAVPRSPIYFEGRFSNGKTWIEYVSQHFGAKLESFAHGQATTDSSIYKLDPRTNVPGCVQQARNLSKKFGDPNQVLLSMSFFGNDFFVQDATKEQYFINLEKCMQLVLDSKASNHIIIPTNFAPSVFPFNAASPDLVQARNEEAAKYIADSWASKLPSLRKENPSVNFYEFDFQRALESIRDNGINYCGYPTKLNTTASCLIDTPFDLPENPQVCEDPDTFMFYDPLHPATRTHEAIAHFAIAAIERKAPRCFRSTLSVAITEPKPLWEQFVPNERYAKRYNRPRFNRH